MIVTELYNGQGLGNQLWCYVVTRTIALDNSYLFGIKSPEKFKAKHFMNIDFGEVVVGGDGPEGGPPTTLPETIIHYYKENLIRNNIGIDITSIDSGIKTISDNTKIDGGMQSEQYIIHRKKEIINWVTPSIKILDYSHDDICVIHFRGGDYKCAGNTLLPVSYYQNSMSHMLQRNHKMKFVVITDDINLAKSYFGDSVEYVGSCLTGIRDQHQANFHIGGDLSIDYSILNNAKNLIISNSSFSWWATWTNQVAKNVLAPKYWAAFNFSDGYWSCGDSLTIGWDYTDRFGKLYTYEQCRNEMI